MHVLVVTACVDNFCPATLNALLAQTAVDVVCYTDHAVESRVRPRAVVLPYLSTLADAGYSPSAHDRVRLLHLAARRFSGFFSVVVWTDCVDQLRAMHSLMHGVRLDAVSMVDGSAFVVPVPLVDQFCEQYESLASELGAQDDNAVHAALRARAPELYRVTGKRGPGPEPESEQEACQLEAKCQPGIQLPHEACPPVRDAIAAGVRNVEVSALTPLCAAMIQNGSDKGGGWHNYTPLYHQLLSSLTGLRVQLFEVGLGTNKPDAPSTMGVDGRPGASVYGWRDYFASCGRPCDVYGADIDRDICIRADGIATFYVDQRDPDSIRALWAQLPGVAFDVMIDDGLHAYAANRTFFEHSIHKLKPGGLYVVEDVGTHDKEAFQAWADELRAQHAAAYLIDVPNPHNDLDNRLLVVQTHPLHVSATSDNGVVSLRAPGRPPVECLMSVYEPAFYDVLCNHLPVDTRGAEVGCFKGGSACLLSHCLARKGKRLVLACHDLFQPFEAVGGVHDIEVAFDAALRDWGVHAIKVKGDSKGTHGVHCDASLDYVLIDGDHTYDGARADILNFAPKLKPDGWLLVQDSIGDVERAVHDALAVLGGFDAFVVRPPWAHYVTVCHRDSARLQACYKQLVELFEMDS